LIRNADLILPGSFGGIERGKGLLVKDAPELPKDATDEQKAELPLLPDVADARNIADNRLRYRFIEVEGEDHPKLLVGSPPSKAEEKKCARFTLDLPSDGDTRRQLISFVPKQERPEFGTIKQTLKHHVGLVEKYAHDIAKRLDLPDDVRTAIKHAAAWHDHGKNRERWQRTVKGQATPPGQDWLDETLGKSGGSMLRDSSGYRHEFGSLREFIDKHEGKIDKDVFDLAMHLIAVHHGRGRPHFSKGGFDPDARSQSPAIHTDAIRRFARLQRKYGHWRLAWLENLLRCADAMASSENEEGDDDQ
jgi:hypothetical protein